MTKALPERYADPLSLGSVVLDNKQEVQTGTALILFNA